MDAEKPISTYNFKNQSLVFLNIPTFSIHILSAKKTVSTNLCFKIIRCVIVLFILAFNYLGHAQEATKHINSERLSSVNSGVSSKNYEIRVDTALKILDTGILNQMLQKKNLHEQKPDSIKLNKSGFGDFTIDQKGQKLYPFALLTFAVTIIILLGLWRVIAMSSFRISPLITISLTLISCNIAYSQNIYDHAARAAKNRIPDGPLVLESRNVFKDNSGRRWIKQSPNQSKFHDPENNYKFISYDGTGGSYEVVQRKSDDTYIIDNSRGDGKYMGTYNYSNNWLVHTKKDIWPWYIDTETNKEKNMHPIYYSTPYKVAPKQEPLTTSEFLSIAREFDHGYYPTDLKNPILFDRPVEQIVISLPTDDLQSNDFFLDPSNYESLESNGQITRVLSDPSLYSGKDLFNLDLVFNEPSTGNPIVDALFEVGDDFSMVLPKPNFSDLELNVQFNDNFLSDPSSSSFDLSNNIPDPPGGVDFSDIVFAGFSYDTLLGTTNFLVKGIESHDTSNISLDKHEGEFKTYFIEALALRPKNLYISLDVLDGKGQVRLPKPMESSHIAREMLDHDILMKTDYLTKNLFGHGISSIQGISSDWVNLVENSIHFEELKSRNFDRYPYIQARAVIIGDTVKLNSENNQFYIQEAPLTLDYELMDLGIDLSDLSLDNELQIEINRLLTDFEGIVKHRMDTGAVSFIKHINSHSDYLKLRTVYTAIASAKLYKSLNLKRNPYAGIINIDTIPISVACKEPFPREHYDSMAYQKLYEEKFQDIHGKSLIRSIWGGVTMQQANLDENHGLSNNQKEKFSITDSIFIHDGNEYFIRTESPDIYVAELYPGQLKVSPVDDKDDFLSVQSLMKLSLKVYNTSYILAGGFSISFIDEFVDEEGNLQSHLIDEVSVEEIAPYSQEEIEVRWGTKEVGTHRFKAIVNPSQSLPELDYLNNDRASYQLVDDGKPFVFFTTVSNQDTLSNKNLKLSYYGFGGTKRFPDEIKLMSDIDGEVSITFDSLNIYVPNLSIGKHKLTLKAISHSNLESGSTVEVMVLPEGVPVVSISYPRENHQVMLTKVEYDFRAISFNVSKDQSFCNDSTVSSYWIVNQDTISTECRTSYVFNEIGPHRIKFLTVKDGISSVDSISVRVFDGTNVLDSTFSFSDKSLNFVAKCNSSPPQCEVIRSLNIPTNALILDAIVRLEGEPLAFGNKVLDNNSKMKFGDLIVPQSSTILNTGRNGYTYHYTPSGLIEDYYLSQKSVFLITEDPKLVSIFTVEKGQSVDFKWEFIFPDGTNQIANRTITAADEQLTKSLVLSIPTFGSNLLGKFSVKVYSRNSTENTFVLEETVDIILGFEVSENDFNDSNPKTTSHSIANSIGTGPEYFPQVNSSKILSQNQKRVYSYGVIGNVADSMLVRWRWIDPYGRLYKSDTLSIREAPSTNQWYDHLNIWSDLQIDNTVVASMPGSWKVFVDAWYYYNRGGQFANQFVPILADSFQIDGAKNISYVDSPEVYFGKDSIPDWTFAGEFRSIEEVSFRNILNEEVVNSNEEVKRFDFPIRLKMPTPGVIKFDNLQIVYVLADVHPPKINKTIVSNIGSKLSVAANVQDYDSISSVTLVYRDEEYSLSRVGESNDYKIENLPNNLGGNFSSKIIAIDRFGNRSERDVRLLIFNPLKNMRLNASVSPNSWSKENLFELSWDIADSSIVSYEIKTGSNTYTVNGDINHYTFSSALEGVQKLTIQGVDKYGNRTPYDTLMTYLDLSPPNKVKLKTHDFEQNKWNKESSIEVFWEPVGDVGVGIDHYEISLNNSISNVRDQVSYRFDELSNGVNTFKVRAVDRLGNEGEWSDAYERLVDHTVPAITLINSPTHPNSDKWYKNNSPSFSWSFSDLHSGIDQIVYLFTSKHNSTPDFNSFSTQKNELDITSLPNLSSSDSLTDGTWYLHLRPIDQAGNVGNISRYTAKIDRTPPNSSHSNKDSIFYLPRTIYFDAFDVHSGVKKINVSVNGEEWKNLDSLNVESSGDYKILYYAEDNAGNEESIDSLSFTAIPQKNSEANILSFFVDGQIGESIIDKNNNLIDILIDSNMNIGDLVAHFTLSKGAIAKVGDAIQESGFSKNDFTHPLIYSVFAENGVNESEWSVNINSENITSIKESTAKTAVVFPNPTDGTLTLKLDKYFEGSKLKLSISDLLGQRLSTDYRMDKNEFFIDISHFRTGMYFITFEYKGEVQTLPIIKK